MPERRASVAALRPAFHRLVAAVLGVWVATVPAASAAGPGAQIKLLPAASRASLVVEIDEAMTTAAALEATDDRAVAVEIGPVHGKVVNQLLQAPVNSPLVSQVRVRGVTQGSDGTVITIYITAKTPVSGSVRRAPGRVYIDLVPQDAAPAAAREATARQAAPPAAPAQLRQTPVRAASAPTLPVSTAARAPGHVAGPPASRGQPPALTDIEHRAAEYARTGDVRSLERLETELQARRATAVAAAGGTSDIDGAITTVEQFVLAAQRNRLAADAALFSGIVAQPPRMAEASAPPAPASTIPTVPTPVAPEAPATAPRPVARRENPEHSAAAPSVTLSAASDDLFANEFGSMKADLVQIARAAGGWSGGQAPAAFDTLSAVLPRLHSLQPPTPMSSAYLTMCASLDELVAVWASASMAPVQPGELRTARRAVAAIDELLQLERRVSRARSQQ